MTAAANVPMIVNAGSGVMAIPAIASVDAIRTSAREDARSQTLGREDQRCRRSRMV